MSKKNKNQVTEGEIIEVEEAEVIEEVPTVEEPAPEKKSKRKLLIGAGVAVGVIGAIAACIFAGRRSNDYIPDGMWELESSQSDSDDESKETEEDSGQKQTES